MAFLASVLPLVAARTAAARPMNRGERRVEQEDDVVSAMIDGVDEHDGCRERAFECGAVNAEVPQRKRDAATLVVAAHFILRLRLM